MRRAKLFISKNLTPSNRAYLIIRTHFKELPQNGLLKPKQIKRKWMPAKRVRAKRGSVDSKLKELKIRK